MADVAVEIMEKYQLKPENIALHLKILYFHHTVMAYLW
jgi:hypothetical protein